MDRFIWEIGIWNLKVRKKPEGFTEDLYGSETTPRRSNGRRGLASAFYADKDIIHRPPTHLSMDQLT
jgi:hypothetical protein